MLEVGISSTRHIAGFWGLTQPAKVTIDTIEPLYHSVSAEVPIRGLHDLA